MKNKFLFSVFVSFIILVLISLGSWQLYRLNWKLNLISEINNSLKNDPVELSKSDKKNYLRIRTSGRIDFDKQIYLYNLNNSGKPGFEVINPILIGNENYLINRGWIPFDKKDKAEINLINTNHIIGILKKQSKANSFKPENDIEKNYWFTLDRDDISLADIFIGAAPFALTMLFVLIAIILVPDISLYLVELRRSLI